MQLRQLGSTGPHVSAIALGCMSMSGMYGSSDDAESIATIHAALDAGINLLDTGDFYGMGHNELLISEALRNRSRDNILLSVKFGALRSPQGAFVGVDGRPAAVKNFAAYSLQRLRASHIDIYRIARIDPAVPIEDTVGAISDLVRSGHVRYIGLSEVGSETIRRAHAMHPICDLQIEYSLMSRSIEESILPVLRELGIGVTAYGVLSRGLLAGSRPVGPSDFRAHLPRFTGENRDRNLQLVAEFEAFAQSRNVTPAALATAWCLAKGSDIVPLIGARKRTQLDAALGALAITLSPADIATLETIFAPEKIAGDRYDRHGMAMLDSEK